MQTGAMTKRLAFTDADFNEIAAAVQKAEAKTTGEIALAVTAESSQYSFWELTVALVVSAVGFCIALPFAGHIEKFYEYYFWTRKMWVLPVFYGVLIFALVIAVFFLCNIPAVDRLVIPRKIKTECVTHRAFRYFTESGVYETKEHSGILIFVSYLERQVRIVADAGIAKQIPQDLWNIIADSLASEIRRGNFKGGYIDAVTKCGELLAEKFPAHKENPNEIKDGLVILEDAE